MSILTFFRNIVFIKNSTEEQERMMQWLARQRSEPQQNASITTNTPHPGSARAAGYGSPFYPPNSDPSYQDDPDRMT
jgi:hypothetical protein